MRLTTDSRLVPLAARVRLEGVFARGRGQLIARSGETVTAPRAGLEVQDVVNCERERSGRAAWRVHFAHILHGVSPVLSKFTQSLAVTLSLDAPRA